MFDSFVLWANAGMDTIAEKFVPFTNSGKVRRMVSTSFEQAMASGDHDAQTLRRYSDAQGRLEHAGGWAWRDRAAARIAIEAALEQTSQAVLRQITSMGATP